MMRRLLKSAAGKVLGGEVANHRIRGRHGRDSLVLAFHNVVPDGEAPRGDHSLHLPLSDFVELIDRLLEIFSPRSLQHVLLPADSPGLAITFDDAYCGALSLALPELGRRGIPSTVFVPTARIGNHEFWWDVLAGESGGLEPELREYVLREMQGDETQVRAWAGARGLALAKMPDLWRSATLEELRTASSLSGVALAPHSSSHRALDRLAQDELQLELHGPLDWFQANGLPCGRTLAYPYGRWSPPVLAATQRAGYEAGWLVSGGWTTSSSTNRFAMPRLNVPAGASVPNMMLRIAEFVGS